jgi:hypothetical protein
VGLGDLVDVDADHGLTEATGDLGDDVGVVVEGGRLDDRDARSAGLPDLKMPEPTKTPSAPSCIIIAASAGVAMPPAVNSTTGACRPRRPRDEVVRRLELLGGDVQLVGSRPWRRRSSARMVRMWVTALETSPVPASPLERIIAAPSVIRRSASPRLVAPHTNGTGERHLSMWLA